MVRAITTAPSAPMGRGWDARMLALIQGVDKLNCKLLVNWQ